ncbi:MAG: aldehyde dehydrogenase family protein [Planctomycetes bacterium]|nr:aldehyde dehydrogenase family protein [Planctomycetota bacterium]
MKMFIGGEWKDKSEKIDVLNPFDGSVVDTVPRGDAADVDEAIAGAVRGAAITRKIPAFDRAQMLRKAADLMLEQQEELAKIVSSEEGKILAEGRVESVRAAEIIQLSAEEAKRLRGEVLPLDGAPGSTGKFGFTIRVPCGVVAAVTPFNFPLHLVCHKVGPALAGGNAVIVKPASDTPLSALKLVEILLEAGVPPLAITCITGSGGQVGDTLCGDKRVRKISFTGSYEVGDHICRTAGMKKVTMELGSNAPLIVMDDADLQKVAEVTAMTGFSNSGQVCISTQRIYVDDKVHDEFLSELTPRVEAITTGDQLADGTKMGPMIRESDAARVHEWIGEAVNAGARLVIGGSREGSVVQPTILDEVDPKMRISCNELFGPAVGITRFTDIDAAIAQANDTDYGLSAAIFTQDLDRAMQFAQEVESGNIHINWGTQWRADLMPYGGLKDSGMGKEGPSYAVEEMTETKMVVMHLKS